MRPNQRIPAGVARQVAGGDAFEPGQHVLFADPVARSVGYSISSADTGVGAALRSNLKCLCGAVRRVRLLDLVPMVPSSHVGYLAGAAAQVADYDSTGRGDLTGSPWCDPNRTSTRSGCAR